MGAKLKESDQYRFVHNMQLIMRVMFKKNISRFSSYIHILRLGK